MTDLHNSRFPLH